MVLGSLAAGAGAGAAVTILVNAVDKATPVLKGVNKTLLATGAALTALGVAGAAALYGLAQPASDLKESVNAVQVTFGDASTAVLAFGDNAAKAFGLSKTEFNSFAVSFSNFAYGIAGEGGDVAQVIKDITQRGTDFASVYNIDVADALTLFRSGLAGETEPLRRYGIDVSAAAVKTYAYSHGIAEVGSELTEGQKVLARYELIMSQTEKTAGDFANTSDSLANRQRILNASVTDLKASLGEALLPAFEAIVGVIQKAVDWFSSLNPKVRTAIVVTAAFTAALLLIIGPIITIIALIPAIVSGLGAVAAGMGAVTIAGAPVWVVLLAIIAAIAALIVIGVLLMKHWDTIKEKAKQLSVILQNAFIAVGNAVLIVWNKIVDVIEHSINQVIKGINKLIAAYNKVASILGLKQISKLSSLNLERFKAELMAYKEYVAPAETAAEVGEESAAKKILSAVASGDMGAISSAALTNSETTAAATSTTASNTDKISSATNTTVVKLGDLEDIAEEISFGIKDLVTLAKSREQRAFNINIENINGLTGQDLADALQVELEKKLSMGV